VKRYGKTVAVDGASFSIREGEIFGLLGPNGAGKTTTISIISTLLRDDGGRVTIGGFDVRREAKKVRPLLGVVPQQTGLFPMLTARENIEYFGGIQGLKGKELKERIAEALAIAGLEQYADKPHVGFFSGGMRRRLNLATGLVHKPRLLILDEPTVGVDTQSRNLILEHIKRLNGEGMTVLYTTHYMEEAEALCDRVAIMDHGKILACDEVSALIAAQSGTTIEVKLAEPAPDFQSAMQAASGVESVTALGGNAYAVLASDQEHVLAAVVGVAGRCGISFETLRIVPPSLEQVFLSLTGRDLRDPERR
jgi:ABC-2 type transport system ATP-binding protein